MGNLALNHRPLSLVCGVLAGVLFHPGHVSALALGNMALQSMLGQPLRVVIPVALSDDESVNNACLKLVRDPAVGTPQLLTGKVSVERNAANTRLIVTTQRPVNEPALRFSVQAGCADTMRRDYVLLLDPQQTESSPMVASADDDQFKDYTAAPRPATPARQVQRLAARSHTSVAADSAAAAPATPAVATTFKRIDPPAPVFVARAQSPALPAAVAAAPSATEPVELTTTQPPGFIPAAAASGLSRVSSGGLNTVAPSVPTALLGTHTQAAEATLWTQTWPYAAILLSLGAIALTAFAKRRRAIVPQWGAPTVSNFSDTQMQTVGAADTFAHFGVMTEPPQGFQRAAAYPTVTDDSTHDASLDTLLEVARVDTIEENAIRKEWATLATESAVDIGPDSILQAISAAERDLHISPSAPAQAAIDQSLDNDLLREPKRRR